MSLFVLPTEVLRDIFSQCKTENITETCRDFAIITHSVQRIWCHIHLRPHRFVPDGPKFLRRRLQRAGILPLHVSVGPVSAASPIISELCRTLSEFNAQISHLEITAETSSLAGTILHEIFPGPPSVFSALKSLSIRVEKELLSGPEGSPWPQLDAVLQCPPAMVRFPKLQTLAIPTFEDSLPIFPETASFSHLRTLVLDGSQEQSEACIGAIFGVLSSVPQLETLWLKHFTREQVTNVRNPGPIKGRDVRLPVRLPQLTTLSVAAPGCGSDIFYCIEAPSLQALHLDGSRGPFCEETEPDDTPWSEWDTNSVQGALKCLASQTRGLRRLAITSIYLTHVGWQWLLFGDGNGPPFPQLESLSLHGLEEYSGQISCGFNDTLLRRFSREPTIALRRLVLLRCTFPLSGSAILEVLRRNVLLPNVSCMLEIDTLCPQIMEGELKTLESLGVTVVRRRSKETKEVEWWAQGHQIDAFDSYAF